MWKEYSTTSFVCPLYLYSSCLVYYPTLFWGFYPQVVLGAVALRSGMMYNGASTSQSKRKHGLPTTTTWSP